MFTLIGADGKHYGPATPDKVLAWIQDGRANLQTQAQRVGETEWRTLGDFEEFNPAAKPAPEPAAADVPPVMPVSRPDIPFQPGRIDVFECLSRSFHLWKDNFLPLVGVTLFVVSLQILIGLIPQLGAFFGLFLNGVLYGGLYYFYLGKIRGEPRELTDVFAGFTRAFMPLVVTTLLQSTVFLAISKLCFEPWNAYLVEVMSHPGTNPALPVLSGQDLAVGTLGALLLVYFSVSWTFIFVLVIDKGFSPWRALATSWSLINRQWFRMFFVVLLGTFLTLLGFFGLFIGVLFTLPLMFGAMLQAYEMVVHPPSGSDSAG